MAIVVCGAAALRRRLRRGRQDADDRNPDTGIADRRWVISSEPEWATQQLDRFLELTELVPLASGRPGKRHAGDKDELTTHAVIVERISPYMTPPGATTSSRA